MWDLSVERVLFSVEVMLAVSVGTFLFSRAPVLYCTVRNMTTMLWWPCAFVAGAVVWQGFNVDLGSLEANVYY